MKRRDIELEVLTTYNTTGNIRETAKLTGVAYSTVRLWLIDNKVLKPKYKTGSIICTKCKKIKSEEEFPKKHQGKYWCKDCISEYNHKYQIGKLGITRKQYKELFDNQNGRCSVCRKTSKRRLVVDHDHKTGKIRGLLCTKCNMSLGLLDDSIDNLKNMIGYLNSCKSD